MQLKVEEEELTMTKRYLVRARVPTRVVKTMYDYPPDDEPTTLTGNSPTLAKRPQYHPYSPYHYPCISPPCMCYHCLEPSPDHPTLSCPMKGICHFCTGTNHRSLDCPKPHQYCSKDNCHVPKWLDTFGDECPAKDSPPMSPISQTNPALSPWEYRPDPELTWE